MDGGAMRSSLRTSVPLLVAMTALLAATASAQTPTRPASETADPFVGTWALNLAKSTYENQPTPKSGMRTYDYERDGLTLVTAHTVTATGQTTFVHYLFTLDGKEYQEMSRGAGGRGGSAPPTYVSAKKISDRAINVEFKSGGKVTISHEWTVSEDGKTFTAKRTASNAQGQRVYSVQVYDKQ
jgi:hypothetical protein